MTLIENDADIPARWHEDLARTGPGTLGGRFMRQFWMPVLRAEDLPAGQAKPIRIMSEDFAIYRGEGGQAQVIDYRCPHRGAQMHLGWVEGDDIRCIYHGWKFDCSGQCIEQPAEDAGFAREVQIGAYPTREYLGPIYAYFGDGQQPASRPIRCRAAKASSKTRCLAICPATTCNASRTRWTRCTSPSSTRSAARIEASTICPRFPPRRPIGA